MSLTIDREEILARIPRGRDELRVTRTHATTDGGPKIWISLRVFYRDASDEWKPGKAGLTIRRDELAQVAEILASEGDAARRGPA